jgi:predicted DNA-binding transcriptional regulator AlpA
MENASSTDRLVTRREAAGLLGLKPQTLARWAMTGQHLPTVKLGRSVRYRLADVQRIIADGSRT